MDLLQDQVSALSGKVDSLHQMLEQLGSQTAEMLSSLKRSERSSELFPSSAASESAGRQTYQAYQSRQSLFDSAMEHKDILSDVLQLDSEAQSADRGITPEIQIQRLTAQLTAAYNRIAALEEQLIAKRIQ
ncbi:MAG: hypothetical protein KME07_01600 [Pegethrix bostrychoides GSE-TBD4-15B]|jgi:uncharacterized protein YukE|uniref:Uncharacterized protein n=1 Tax=Pegethrix bostrychoides GSE-TBD4-15B TaxID=2839662 RepID=A0A951P879_9CYAN|nr:hypothetical protein [Pegethrix bostrychoides GSE-TBD4-15B]